MQQIKVSVENVHPNKNNPRWEAGDVTELAASIREGGLLQPLLVVPAGAFYGDGHYIIEDGFRRWTAAKQVLSHVDVIVQPVHEGESLATRALITGLTTDQHNKTLTPMEKAKAYGRLRDEEHLTQAQIAKMVGVDSSTVSRYLTLYELAPAAQKRVQEGKLSVDDAIRAVQKHRAKVRQGEGKKPVDVGWEPDHFTDKHHLAKKARKLCQVREHNSRRQLGKLACGQCWEDAIRQDQTVILQAAYLDAQREGTNPIFLPPFNNASNGVRNGVVGNGI